MSTPQWAAFVSAVVDALTADSLIGGAGIPVLDGPSVSGSEAESLIVIGGHLDDADVDAGSFTSDWRSDGGTSAARDETLTVNCDLQFWTGEADIATARTGAFALLGSVDRVLRAAPTLGLGRLLWCQITAGSIRQELRSGALVGVAFTIQARSVI